ncbi:MAG: hypothetical protein V3W18_03850, partial [candidate division Zixibacteria bacterium]
VIAWLHLALSAIGIVVAIFLFFIIAGAGMISGDEVAMAVTAVVATFLAILILVLSIPGIIGGIFLLKRKEWARILLLIVAFLNLLNIPFGTALGIYTIWALMKDETIQLFKTPESAG